MTMCDTLYIVVPCYNEEEVLPETARRLGDKLRGLMAAGKISPKSRVLFVNDGSRDGTWGVISRLHAADPLFRGGPEPEPGSSECPAGRAHDCPGPL